MSLNTLSQKDREQIIDWNSGLSRTVDLGLVLTEDERSSDFSRFCETFSALAPRLKIIRQKDDTADKPAVRVGTRLIYEAIPLGPELSPFLEAIGLQHQAPTALPDQYPKTLDQIKIPATLKLFITPHCPYCPKMVRRLAPLAIANDRIKLSIIDGTLFPEAAQQHQVQSAPTLILDEDFRWTGVTPHQEIITMLANRDPTTLGTDSIRGLLSTGDASRVAEMMLAHRKIFPALLALLVHEKWPVRLGAMVVVEEIADKDIQLAGTIIDPLKQRFGDIDDAARGDILYLFGQVGGMNIVPHIEEFIKSTDNEELREAGMEAIASIRERTE